jgi:putative ATPase
MDASRDAKAFGHGQSYRYPHDHEGHFIPQQYLPDAVMGKQFYSPSDQGREAQIAEQLKRWRHAQKKYLQEIAISKKKRGN